MTPHPLTSFEIQKFYQNEPRFNGVFSRDNLPKIKDGTYIINLDEYSDIGTHWVALYVHNNNVTYFDSFGVEHIPKEIRTFINNKNVKTNIFKIQEYDLIMCGYFCIRFIDFILAGKKFWLIILICFLLMILRKNMILFLLISKMNDKQIYLNKKNFAYMK